MLYIFIILSHAFVSHSKRTVPLTTSYFAILRSQLACDNDSSRISTSGTSQTSCHSLPY